MKRSDIGLISTSCLLGFVLGTIYGLSTRYSTYPDQVQPQYVSIDNPLLTIDTIPKHDNSMYMILGDLPDSAIVIEGDTMEVMREVFRSGEITARRLYVADTLLRYIYYHGFERPQPNFKHLKKGI